MIGFFVVVALANLLNSIRRLAFLIVLLTVSAFVLVFSLDRLISAQMQLNTLFSQTVRTLIVVSFGLIIVFLSRHAKVLLSRKVGTHLATVTQFFMILIVGIIMMFAVLDIFEVSPTTLLVGGGIASIIIGLVISTFVGNILAGTLVLMTQPYKVGDVVTVNNVPGEVEEITAMVTRIRNDIGGLMVIPNTAIIQGGVIVTAFPASETQVKNRLPYTLGDRVYTTYMNQEGTVKELTPFFSKILLDSGRELTFLNSSVLTGNIAVAKISHTS